MTTQTKKRIAWALMSGGMGAVGLFVAVIVQEGLPPARIWVIYFWPGSGLAIGAAGFFWLRRLYQYEPPEPPAAWTMSLADLILGSLFAGLCGALAVALDDDSKRAAPFILFLGIAVYLQSALAASLDGIFSTGRRVVFVIAHILFTLGAMGWMTMGVMSVLLIGLGESSDLLRFWSDVILAGRGGENWIWVIRVCLYASPIGVLSMALVKRRVAAKANGGRV